MSIKSWASAKSSGGIKAGRPSFIESSKAAKDYSAQASEHPTAAIHEAAAGVHASAARAAKREGNKAGEKLHKQISENHKNEAAVMRERDRLGVSGGSGKPGPFEKPGGGGDDRNRDDRGRFA